MFQFISDNILLVLTLLAIMLSFLGSFIGLISKKKPVLILAILAIIWKGEVGRALELEGGRTKVTYCN